MLHVVSTHQLEGDLCSALADSKSEERDEVDSGRPVSRQSADLCTKRRSRQMSVTLDKFTGDSLLHFSYSAAVGGGAGGMHPDSSLGELSVRGVMKPSQTFSFCYDKELNQYAIAYPLSASHTM